MSHHPTPAGRRADIDALRVGAFALLILYHAGMPFSGWGWHIDDAVWPALQEAMRFLNRWRMPLVFFVAGAGIMLALGRRGAGAFAVERVSRLGLPLLFGMAVIVPPQVYAERVAEGAFAGSYLAFLPHAFDGVYPVGNLSWHHLWFLAYALTMSLGLLPLFLALRSPGGGRLLEGAVRRLGPTLLLWALALPSLLFNLVEDRIPGNDNALLGDWRGLLGDGLVLVMGAVIYRSPDLAAAMERRRHVHLIVGVAGFLLLRLVYMPLRGAIDADPALHALHAVVEVANSYGMILALAGYARHWFAAPRGPWLTYATEAVFPFYILHQTITVLAAWALLDSPLPVPARFALLVLATFAGSFILYEGLIRRVSWLRPLFGLKRRGQGPTLACLLRPATATA